MSEFVEESSATLGANEVPGSSASETKGILDFIILPIFLFLWKTHSITTFDLII